MVPLILSSFQVTWLKTRSFLANQIVQSVAPLARRQIQLMDLNLRGILTAKIACFISSVGIWVRRSLGSWLGLLLIILARILATKLQALVACGQSQNRWMGLSSILQLHIGHDVSMLFETWPLQVFTATTLCHNYQINLPSLLTRLVSQTFLQLNLKLSAKIPLYFDRASCRGGWCLFKMSLSNLVE